MNPSPLTRRKLLCKDLVPWNDLAVAIVRGSTLRQLNTLDAQTLGAERFSAIYKLNLHTIIVDRGTSTSIPFFQREKVREAVRLMADLHCNQLILTRVDRAFRSQIEQIAVLQNCYAAGVIVHFSEQDVPKPTSASGRFMLNTLGNAAQFEKDLRRERQIEASEVQRLSLHKCGQNAPYGWLAVLDPTGRKTTAGAPAYILVPIPEQQEVIREILRRHDDGESDEYIAAVLNEARIPTAKAGQPMRRKLPRHKWPNPEEPVWKTIICSGKWHASTVFSVRSYARTEAEAPHAYALAER